MINGPSLIDDVADVTEIQADLARLLDAIEAMAGERMHRGCGLPVLSTDTALCQWAAI